MKRPHKGDKLKIRIEATGETFDEVCHDIRDDRRESANGIQFEVLTHRNYDPDVQYSFIGADGGEILGSIVKILTTPGSKTAKLVVFYTILPAA